MAKQGPRGGGDSTASRQIRVGGHGAEINTFDTMDKAAEFDRAGASFRRRRKRASLDLTSLSTAPIPAKQVVEAATLIWLVSSVISSRVPCAPTLPAASFQQACECRGLVSSRTYSSRSSLGSSRTISRPSSRTSSRMPPFLQTREPQPLQERPTPPTQIWTMPRPSLCAGPSDLQLPALSNRPTVLSYEPMSRR
jgi:hypothetical protein